MNMMTSKPQYGIIPLKDALALADGDIELIRACKLIARNGKPYISHRLLMIKLAEKQKEQEDAKRNKSSDGRRSSSVPGDSKSPKGVGSLILGLKKFFCRVFGAKRPS